MTKRAIALLICLLAVGVLFIVNSTVFVVKNISVIDYNTKTAFIDTDKLTEEDILRSSGVDLKTNIFTISEEKVKKNIEAALPHAKVIKAERIFPCNIVITVLKRLPLCAVENGNEFIIIDREGAVLETKTPIAIKEDKLQIVEVKGINAGDARLVQIIEAYELSGYKHSNFVSVVKQITFSGTKVTIESKRGVKFRFNNTDNINIKVREAMSWYNGQEDDAKRSAGILIIAEREGTEELQVSYSPV